MFLIVHSAWSSCDDTLTPSIAMFLFSCHALALRYKIYDENQLKIMYRVAGYAAPAISRYVGPEYVVATTATAYFSAAVLLLYI